MRSIVLVALVVLVSAPRLARAHDIGTEHTHEAEPGAKRDGVSLMAYGGFALGGSLGGDYESCTGANRCLSRKRPSSPMMGAHVAYALPNGIAFEIGAHYITGIHTQVRRTTTLFGEQSTPVRVDITDDFDASGPALGAGVTYTPIRAPVAVTVGIEYARWSASFSSVRAGTAEVVDPPSPRALKAQTKPNDDTVGYNLFLPKVRVSYPLHRNFEIGVEIAGILAIGEARPLIKMVVETTPDDRSPKALGPDGTPHSIGFVPQPDARPESAMETFFLIRPSLYARVIF